MNTRFKVFASYNILQYLFDFIHVLIFVTVSKCQKSPKLTNIVILVLYLRTTESQFLYNHTDLQPYEQLSLRRSQFVVTGSIHMT